MGETETITPGSVGEMPAEMFTPPVDPNDPFGGAAANQLAAEGLEGAPSPEELAARTLDHEGDERTIAELLIPAGGYNTMPPARVRETEYKDNDGGKRLVYMVTANVVNNRDINQKIGDQVRTFPAGSIEDSVDFRFSHQRRNKDDGEPDGATKRYLELKDAYKAAHGGEAPKYTTDLVKYIEQYPVHLRISQFSHKNWVVGITAIKV